MLSSLWVLEHLFSTLRVNPATGGVGEVETDAKTSG